MASEDAYTRRMDQCTVDSFVKAIGGFAVGSIASLLFFKRRMWPITLGSGVGIGLGYSDCQKVLNEITAGRHSTDSDTGEIKLS